MKVKFLKLNENAKLPIKGDEFAGGWDIYATEIIYESDRYVRVKTGFATEIPNGYMMRISPRSNITKSNWFISNSPGLIDSSYRNEWEIRFKCIPDSTSILIPYLNFEPFPYEVGDRVAQSWLEEVLPIEWIEVDELEESERGLGGFGSTGVT